MIQSCIPPICFKQLLQELIQSCIPPLCFKQLCNSWIPLEKIGPEQNKCPISQADWLFKTMSAFWVYFLSAARLINRLSPRLCRNRKHWSVIVLSSQWSTITNHDNIKTRDSYEGCPCGKFTFSDLKGYLTLMYPLEIQLQIW